MNTTTRKRILRVNGVILGLFGAISFFMLDVRGIWFDSGPQTAVLRGMPAAGVGFLEAHGLAVILAIWFWRAGRADDPERAWHFTAAAAHALLAACNITLWSIFVICDVLTLGYVVHRRPLRVRGAAVVGGVVGAPDALRLATPACTCA
jgi:hypothetical protein